MEMLIEQLQYAEYWLYEARVNVAGYEYSCASCNPVDFVSSEDLESLRVAVENIMKKANEAKAA